MNNGVLTPDQTEILGMLGSGMTRKQIGPAKGLSVKTVDHHINEIRKTLGIQEIHALIRFAVDNKLATNPKKPADPLTKIAKIKTIGDLSQALFKQAEKAANGDCDVIQANALCNTANTIIDLARLSMQISERGTRIRWLDDNPGE